MDHQALDAGEAQGYTATLQASHQAAAPLSAWPLTLFLSVGCPH
jgi:hypothetical protein